MITLTVVLAAALIALGVAASATRHVDLSRAIAAGAAGLALVLVAIGMAAVASVTDRVAAAAALPVLIASSAVAIGGAGRATTAGVVSALVAGPLAALFADPFSDASCESDCYVNPLAVWPNPPLGALLHGLGLAALAVALAVAVFSRRRLTLLSLSMAVPAAAAIATAWPWDITSAAGGLVAAGTAVAVLVVELFRGLSRYGQLAALTDAMAWDGDAEASLRRLAPDLEVGYRVDGRDDLVDRSGRSVSVEPDGIDVVGPDGVIARLQHVRALGEARAIARLVRGPARLSLENQRLAAQGEVRARDIATSARRVVQYADEQRRELERDLHDGAQQGLLGLGLLVRIAADDGTVSTMVADSVIEQVLLAVGEVREIGHGIYRAALDSGLDHALRLLATRSPVPLTLLRTPERATGVAVSIALYAAVEQVVSAWAVTGSEPAVSVSVCEVSDGFTLEIGVTGMVGDLERVEDRFRALGGRLTWSAAPDAVTLRGWLPWASE